MGEVSSNCVRTADAIELDPLKSLLVRENSDTERIGEGENSLFLFHEKTRTPFCFCFASIDCKCASSLRKELSKRSKDAGVGEADV